MKRLLVVVASMILLFSCKKNDAPEDQQCTYDPCAFKAPASEIQQVQNYLAANNIVATQHCSGLFYSIENAGTGTTADVCSDITAKYKGTLSNGTVFDQTQGTDVLETNLSRLIRGWLNGIPLIKAGGKIHLYIPPSLAYGAADQKDQYGTVVIPGNSIVIFDVDLIAVR